MKTLLLTIIFCFFAVLSTFTVSAAPSAYQKILILESGDDDTDSKLQKNITTTLKTVKVHFKSIDIDSDDLEKELSEMGPADFVVISAPNIPTYLLQSRLIKYVSEGGNIYFAYLNVRNEAMMRLAGIKDLKGQELSKHNKISTSSLIFPGLDKSGDDIFSVASQIQPVELESGAEVLMSSDSGLPVLWRYKYGKGTVMVFNASTASDAVFCGTLLQTMAMLPPYFLSQSFNAKVFFIDDFPAPIPLGTEYVIATHYDGMGYEEFYKEIWWPQMKTLAEKYKIKYTCLALANYENSVNMPPPPFTDRVRDSFRYYGHDLLKHGHEIGIHGYNHASLLMADYKEALAEIGYQPWKSVDDMETSLRFLRKSLDETVGKRQYYSYVPPMNMLSREGKEAILRVFPEMKCFAGLGDSSLRDAGVLYQDIGFDPDFPKVYALPRYSSGQIYSHDWMVLIYNYLAYNGLFSHFIHPDELLDSERCENKNWEELYSDMEHIMKDVNDRFPFLRPMNATDFVNERLRTYKTEIYSYMSPGKITITYENASVTDPLFHYLRLNNGDAVKSVENGKFTRINGTPGLYLIEGNKSPVTVNLERAAQK